MKAWNITALGAPDKVLSVVDKTLPTAGPGELRVRVDAAAIGLPDVLMCRGHYEYKPELPFTAGQEVCGTVVEVGEGVSSQVGDRVMGVTSFFAGQGGFAQECMSLEGMMFPVPDGMNNIDAAAFGIPYQTAWIALVSRGKIKAGETLVVLGATGGCGSAAIQLGKALGAKVIAIVGSKEKVEPSLSLGADEVINYQQQNFVDEVNRLTEGKGANLIYDPVGGETFTSAISCLANEGRLLAVGFASGSWGETNTHELVIKNASIVGVFVGSYSPEQRREVHEELIQLHKEGRIAPIVERVVDFLDLPQALSDVESRKVIGKLVLDIGE